MEFEKLQTIIAEIFQTDAEMVQREKSFVKDFGSDTLSMFQLLLGVEAEFGLIIEQEEALEWKTVNDVWQCIREQ